MISKVPRLLPLLLLALAPWPASAEDELPADFVKNWNSGRVPADTWLEITFKDEYRGKRNLWCLTAECGPVHDWAEPVGKMQPFMLFDFDHDKEKSTADVPRFTAHATDYTAQRREIPSYRQWDKYPNLTTRFAVSRRNRPEMDGFYELAGVPWTEGVTYERGFLSGRVKRLMIPHGYARMEVLLAPKIRRESPTPFASLGSTPDYAPLAKSYQSAPARQWLFPIENGMAEAEFWGAQAKWLSAGGGGQELADHARGKLRRVARSYLAWKPGEDQRRGFTAQETKLVVWLVEQADAKEAETSRKFFDATKKLTKDDLPGFIAGWREFLSSEMTLYLSESDDSKAPAGALNHGELLSQLNARTIDFLAGKSSGREPKKVLDEKATKRIKSLMDDFK